MIKTRQLIILPMIVLLSLMLAGCFHLRNGKEIPAPLHTLYISAPKNELNFTNKLTNMLTSLGIRIVKQPQSAKYALRVKNIEFSHSNSDLITTQNAVNYTYTLNATMSIYNTRNQKTIAGPRQLSASRTIIVSSSQIYVPQAVGYSRNVLTRNLIDQIYYWLTSDQVRHGVTQKK